MYSGDTINVVENSKKNQMFKRHFTKDNHRLSDFGISFVARTAHIENAQGEVIFHQDNVIVPDFWSQTAVNILAQKYLRRVGVPNMTVSVPSQDVPHQFWRNLPHGVSYLAGETDFRQVVYRLTGHWIYTGFLHRYFTDVNEALIFRDELTYMLYNQMAAPNSPQFFNTGLYWAYGIKGGYRDDNFSEGFDAKTILHVFNAYEAPQIHACFINKVDDTLVGNDSIMALWTKEARIFKFGSGSGCNYSAIRGKNEPLAGGGVSSGLMSFLKIGDAVGGAIKSGGTTRRASRNVIVDVDHPDLLEFIGWKVKEEEKARALIEGSKLVHEAEPDFPVYTSAFEGEAYTTISGQNANNSVNISNAFMQRTVADGFWDLKPRTGKVYNQKPQKARNIFHEIASAAWKCGDPGVFFGDNINEWNTCINDEKIIAANPCFEYLWFSNTACNLASLNLLKFYNNKQFDVEAFCHATALWTVVLDISISMAGYPSKAVAKKSLQYRTLGLGYTNLGALLMVMGVSYAEELGRTIAADITALLTGQAYLTSAELAERLEPFPAYEANKDVMFKVLGKHLSHVLAFREREQNLYAAIVHVWNKVLEKDGYRNAQVSALAPTGTISLLMDAQTTGVEPDFALVKYKELAGGGQLKLVNEAVEQSLINLGYMPEFIQSIRKHISETGSMKACKLIPPAFHGIFACANEIEPESHLAMLAAIQPFVSGGISKTINLPNSATVNDITEIYFHAWELGLKCVSVYRDGCKASQPLTAKKEPPKDNKSSEAQLSLFATKSVLIADLNVYSEQDVIFHENKTVCQTCGFEMTLRAGVCHLCPVCGSTTGCS